MILWPNMRRSKMANYDYTDLATSIVEKVGGKNNINSVTNCMTRLRFELKDDSKADTEAIKKIKGVQGTILQGGQYQIIIGTHVKDVVKDVRKVAGISENAASSGTDKNQSASQKLFKVIAGCVLPLIPAMVASGVIKGILTILTMTGVLANTDGTYIILYAGANAVMFFLPILVGFNAAKVFGCNEMIGATIGAALVYPSLSDILTMIHPEYSAVETAATNLSFLKIPVNLIDYSSTMLPVILAVFLAAQITKLAERIVPRMLQLIFVPTIVVGITVPAAFLVIGPVMTVVSNAMSSASLFVFDHVPVLGGILFGGLWQLVVLLGIHGAFIPVLLNNLFTLGYDPLNACMGLSVWAVAGAGLGYGLKVRNKEKKSMGISNTVTALCGITEPTIYSTLLPHMRLFAAVIAGGGISGAILAGLGGKMYSFVGDGIFRIPAMINPAGIDISFYGFIVCALIAISVSAAVAYVLTDRNWDSEEEDDTTTSSTTTGPVELVAFADGDVLPIENVEDATFSQKILGDGIAIEPAGNTIVAPANAVVTAVTDTRHAVGMVLDNGTEILIHVGIDTVDMNGEGFELLVNEGDRVKTGEKILTFDSDRIAAAGHKATTMLVITDMAEASDAQMHSGITAVKGQTAIMKVA